MKKIPLTKGYVALVDDEDYEWLTQWGWYASDANPYAARKPTTGVVLMHREIMKAPKGMEVDHINGNRLDNRKANLRLCTRGENARNTKKPITNKSGFKGVSFFSRDGNWRASIQIEGKSINLGYYDTPEKAAKAYDAAAKECFGNFAYRNFL